jgi:hypothetical protein
MGTAQQLAPQTRFGTHDWTAPLSQIDFEEFWADVKSPGDGRTYLVGTIDVQQTATLPLFSTAPVSPVPLPAFTLVGAQTKQITILQIRDAAQVIVQQRYFYGTDAGGLTQNQVPTNARGISVWPAANLVDSRIVICGETFDQRIPSSQAPNGFPSSNGTNASGFIAVYNGNAVLLWTHHLFGANDRESAVTDVSVRVEFDAQGQPVRDVITYCGISSHGNPVGGNQSLTPIQPFAAPTGALPCSNPAGGATNNGVNQWDGFVGRIARDHAALTPTVTEFHSVVGGNQQDGLFGIAELPDDRFVVVGATAGLRAGIPAPMGPSTFPLTTGLCLSQAPQPPGFCLGTVLLFDASATPAGALVLQDSRQVGAPGVPSTIARDVLAHANTNLFNNPVAANTIFVVGSTNDANLFAGVVPFPPTQPFAAGTDGFVLVAVDDHTVPAAPVLNFQFATFHGGPGDDGLTGVNGWNEYVDQVVVAGFREDGSGLRDIDLASLYVFALPNPPVGGQPAFSVRYLTTGQVGGTGDDFPTAMGIANATNSPLLAYLTFGLGDPAGGGVAQNESGRVNVVGSTDSLNYPFPGGLPRSTTLVPAGQQAFNDGAHTTLDLLPGSATQLAGRTDGTGQPVPLPGVQFPIAGTDGGTTPPCSRLPFGTQLGRPAPPLFRMLIDYEGNPLNGNLPSPPAPPNTPGSPPGPGANGAIVIVRPPVSSGFVFAALQLGFPGAPGTSLPFFVMPDGIEVYTNTNPSVIGFVPIPNASFRFILNAMPPAPFTFTAQVVCTLVNTAIPAGNPAAGQPCGGVTQLAASPALWITY